MMRRVEGAKGPALPFLADPCPLEEGLLVDDFLPFEPLVDDLLPLEPLERPFLLFLDGIKLLDHDRNGLIVLTWAQLGKDHLLSKHDFAAHSPCKSKGIFT